jgi:ABC-type sulfate/molybdate transport systems ATPase subunit
VQTAGVIRLDRLSFTLRRGQMLGVLGGSGAGKSTLLKAITGSDPALVGLVVSAVSMFAHDSARAWHDVATGTNLVRARPWDFGRQPVQAAASATPPTAPAATTVEGAPS